MKVSLLQFQWYWTPEDVIVLHIPPFLVSDNIGDMSVSETGTSHIAQSLQSDLLRLHWISYFNCIGYLVICILGPIANPQKC